MCGRLRAMWAVRVAVAYAICVAVGIPGARAEEGPARASELLQRGRQALIDKDTSAARSAFEQGLPLAENREQRWRMMLGLALATEIDGDTLASAYAYRRFLDDSVSAPEIASEPWKSRRARVLRDVERLEVVILVDHARIDLQSDPTHARVVIDDRVTDLHTPAVVYLTAGTRALGLEREGYESETLELAIEPGQRALLHRKLFARAALPAPAPLVSEPSSTTQAADVRAEDDSVGVLVPGAITAAGGAALLIAAGALHWAALRDAEEVRGLAPSNANIARDDELRGRIEDYQVAYVSLYALGGALAAAGAALVIYDVVAPDHPVAWLMPVPSGAVGGISATW